MLGASPGRVWREVDLPIVATRLAGRRRVRVRDLARRVRRDRVHRAARRPDRCRCVIFRLLGQPGPLNFGAAMAASTILMVLTAASRSSSIERLRVGRRDVLMLDGRAASPCATDDVAARRRRRPDGRRRRDRGVLGPSGCGKSTLLRADRGARADVDGRSCDGTASISPGVPPHRRGFGLMFQDHALFPHRDVVGNVGVRAAHAAASTRRGRSARHARCSRSSGSQASSTGASASCRAASSSASRSRARSRLRPRSSCSTSRSVRSTARLRERLVAELRGLFVRLGLTIALRHPRPRRGVRARRSGRVMHAGRVEQVGARPRSGDDRRPSSSPASSAGT